VNFVLRKPSSMTRPSPCGTAACFRVSFSCGHISVADLARAAGGTIIRRLPVPCPQPYSGPRHLSSSPGPTTMRAHGLILLDLSPLKRYRHGNHPIHVVYNVAKRIVREVARVQARRVTKRRR
jgi:hypothetical protein